MQRGPKAKPPRLTYSILRSDGHLPAMDSADRRLRPVALLCESTWQERLDRRVNTSPVALAKSYTALPGPTGTKQPRDEDIDDEIC